MDSYKLGTLSCLVDICKLWEKLEGKVKMMISANDVETSEDAIADVCIGLKIEYLQLKAISNIENACKMKRLEDIISAHQKK